MILILCIATVALGLVAVWIEYSRTLMMVQQNSYRIERYNRYLRTSGESTSWSKLLCAAIFLFSLIHGVPEWVALGVQALFFAIVAGTEMRRTYKKPLVRTPRVWRLTGAMWVLTIAVAVGYSLYAPTAIAACYSCACVLTLAWFAAAWVAIAALWALRPVENAINLRYQRDAERILASMPDLKVVGITGSYGKTSTKHYLYRILSEKFSVCMTPGSFNTTMGVIRTVREYLQPYNQVFICEMGAKQPGDINEICRLVRPSIGIVTAVGPQHLESFKTIENVQRTKFELVDSLPSDGLAVVNDDFPMIACRKVTGVKTERYGIAPRPELTYWVEGISYSPSGTDFTVQTPTGPLQLHTRLVGECNVSNLVAAVAVALHLGVSPEQIAYAVSKIEQVEHRLNIKRTPGGITIIDDAFNSNPTGSAMALDVLAAMNGGQRIVITPGMIELGNEQYELNRVLGEKINGSADVAIIVGQYNRDALLDGLGESPRCKVHAVDSFAQAQQLLASIARPDDTVLYENDLPDTFK